MFGAFRYRSPNSYRLLHGRQRTRRPPHFRTPEQICTINQDICIPDPNFPPDRLNPSEQCNPRGRILKRTCTLDPFPASALFANLRLGGNSGGIISPFLFFLGRFVLLLAHSVRKLRTDSWIAWPSQGPHLFFVSSAPVGKLYSPSRFPGALCYDRDDRSAKGMQIRNKFLSSSIMDEFFGLRFLDDAFASTLDCTD